MVNPHNSRHTPRRSNVMEDSSDEESSVEAPEIHPFSLHEKGTQIRKKSKYHMLNEKSNRYLGRCTGKVLREIRLQQKTTNLLIPKASFARLVKEIGQEFAHNNLYYQSEALLALQEGAEHYLVQLLETSCKLSRHRQKATLQVSDIQLLREILALYGVS